MRILSCKLGRISNVKGCIWWVFVSRVHSESGFRLSAIRKTQAHPPLFGWVFLRLLTWLTPAAFACRTFCGKSKPAIPWVSHISVCFQLFWMAAAVKSIPWKDCIKDEIQSLYEEWLSTKNILNKSVSSEGSLNLNISPPEKSLWTRSAQRCLRSRKNLERCTRFWLEWTLRYYV